MSISSDAFLTALKAASHTSPGPPTKVTTVRFAALPGQQLIDWGGAQRWLGAEQGDANELRQRAERLGGHTALFRGGDRSAEVFHPLPAALHELHRRLKQAFDPRGILNPGRMYAAL